MDAAFCDGSAVEVGGAGVVLLCEKISVSSMCPGAGPKYSQSEGLNGPIAEELVGKTLELVFGGTGGGRGPLSVAVDDPKSVATASGGCGNGSSAVKVPL